MPNGNLNRNRKPGKTPRFVMMALMALAVLVAAGCEGDNPFEDSLPSGFSLKGEYFLTQRTRTTDGVNYQTERQQVVGGMVIGIGGVMTVGDQDSVVSAVYELRAYPFSRNYTIGGETYVNSGYVIMDGRTVWLMYNGGETVLSGDYSEDDEWIRVNYTQSNILYTETWKKVRQATEFRVPNDGLPYVP